MLVNLKINSSSIKKNLEKIRSINENVICVIKDDAYGLKIEKILPILIKNNCNYFAVAYLEEAVKVYKILKLIENISRVFAAIIAAIGVTLLFKQMRIWLYEHKERIDIMTLFGAPFWLKSAALFKIAVFDSVFAAILVIAFYSALPGLNLVNTSEIGVDLPTTDLLADGAKLIGVSLILAAVSVILVMRRAKRDDI